MAGGLRSITKFSRVFIIAIILFASFAILSNKNVSYTIKVEGSTKPKNLDYIVINNPDSFNEFSVSLSKLGFTIERPYDSKYVFNLDIEYKIVDLAGGYLVRIPNAKYYVGPGAPYVAVREFVLDVGDKIVKDVFVLGGEVKYVVLPEFLRAPPPVPLYPANLNIPNYDEVDEGYFPDNIILSWYQWGTKLHISASLTIYDMSSHKAYILDRLEIGLKYGLKTRGLSRSLPLEIAESQYIVITSEELAENLTRLINLHSDLNPVIVNTSWIYENFPPATDPPVPGFSNSSLPMWSEINEIYNYTLALKIISFLRELTDKKRFVVLVGDTEIIPPSYYYWHEDFYENYEDYPLDAWVPTDYFYISPDYDFSADLHVARIPVDTPEQLETYIDKLLQWKNALDSDEDWVRKLYAFAGAPFFTLYFVGESLVNNIANDGYFGNLTVKKFFETDGNYTVWELHNVFIRDLPGILMVMSHGTYTGLWKANFGSPFVTNAYDELISTSFLQNLNSTNITVMVTIACESAGFDIGEYYGNNSLSFAEAAIVSEGGAVAYLGNTRISFGSYSFYLDDGKLMFLTQPYAQGIVYYFFETYANGTNIIGETFAETLDKYYSNFGIQSSYHLRAILEAIMFGDPALVLPKIKRDTNSAPTVESAESWEHEGKEIYRLDGSAARVNEDEIAYVFINGSDTLNVTLVSPHYQLIRNLPEVKGTVNPPAVIAVKPAIGGVNILKVADNRNHESRYYIFVPMIHLLEFKAEFLDTDNNGKYEAINVSIK
ncbi:hypothetical protein DRP04_09070, partial [Archaeoglobales archaeon]